MFNASKATLCHRCRESPNDHTACACQAQRQVEINHSSSLFPLSTVLLQDRHFQPHQTTAIYLPPQGGRGDVYGEMCDPHPPFSLRLCAFSPACIPFSEPLRLLGDKTNDAILGVIFCCPPCRCLSPLCDRHSRQRPPSSHPPTTLSSAPSSSSAGSDGPEEEGHNK